MSDASPPEIKTEVVNPIATDEDPDYTLRAIVSPEKQETADNVLRHSTSDMIVVDIRMIKAQLLKIPINAYATCCQMIGSFERQGQPHMASLYRECANQLRHDGYAPCIDGSPGPAVKEFYSRNSEAVY